MMIVSSARRRTIMPTITQMAKGYMEQIENKITDLETQLEMLRAHLLECKEEITKENEDD